jgi:hypothetical protein
VNEKEYENDKMQAIASTLKDLSDTNAKLKGPT